MGDFLSFAYRSEQTDNEARHANSTRRKLPEFLLYSQAVHDSPRVDFKSNAEAQLECRYGLKASGKDNAILLF
jgi:hypothetical protein